MGVDERQADVIPYSILVLDNSLVSQAIEAPVDEMPVTETFEIVGCALSTEEFVEKVASEV